MTAFTGRRELRRIDKVRTTFRGVFVRAGTKAGWTGRTEPTLLLNNVTDVTNGQVVADHLWFTLTAGFAALGPLVEGDVIEFVGRVQRYDKGYRGHDDMARSEKPASTDYKLSRPTQIRKVTP